MRKTLHAYFTSGSTGKPKGKNHILKYDFVRIPNYQLKIQKEDVFSDFHDSSFVMSLVTILPYICGSPCFIKETDKIFASKIIKENKVSVLITVPSFMMVLIKLKKT